MKWANDSKYFTHEEVVWENANIIMPNYNLIVGINNTINNIWC